MNVVFSSPFLNVYFNSCGTVHFLNQYNVRTDKFKQISNQMSNSQFQPKPT
jgi:hypothetical protein